MPAVIAYIRHSPVFGVEGSIASKVNPLLILAQRAKTACHRSPLTRDLAAFESSESRVDRLKHLPSISEFAIGLSLDNAFLKNPMYQVHARITFETPPKIEAFICNVRQRESR